MVIFLAVFLTSITVVFVIKNLENKPIWHKEIEDRLTEVESKILTIHAQYDEIIKNETPRAS